MSPAEERQYWQRFIEHRDIPARDQLFMGYKNWADIEAIRLHRQLSMPGVELGDLQQWAYAGMLEAIERFSLQHDVTFKAFAVHRVRGAIFSALPTINEVSAHYAKRGRFLAQNTAQDQPPSEQPWLSTSDDDTEDLEPVSELVSAVMDMAIDYMLQEPGDELKQLKGGFYSSPEINAMNARIRDQVEKLDEPMKSIITLYYFEAFSFDKIAKLIELSNGRVSQLHKQAIQRLKARFGW